MLWLCPVQSIETDERVKKPDQIKAPVSSEEEREAIMHLEQAIASDGVTPGESTVRRQQSFIPHHDKLCR